MSSNGELLALAYELWHTVRESIPSIDRDSIAESVVAILIDHDCGPLQIKAAFRGDQDIIEAVNLHIDDIDDEDDEEDDEDVIDYSFGDHDDDDDIDENW
jgi:uncharacterized protein YjfI (DUF2170 family)